MGQDLQVIGFAEDEITALFSAGRRGLTDPDFAPEPLPAPVTQPGEVWLLGEHRLVCGDCTEAAIAEAALAGANPHLLVSDPPYGVGYDPAWRNRAGMSTSRRTGKVANDDTADWRAAYALFPGRRGLRLARQLAIGRFRSIADRQRLRASRADHMGEGPASDQPRALPLAARTLLVRGAEGSDGALARRSEADHAVADREPRAGHAD